MALDTYANLKTAMIDWSHRDDLDSRMDDFIDIAESHMFANDDEPLQLRAQESEKLITTNTNDRFATIPAGFQSARKMRIQITNGESYEVYYRSPSQMEIVSNEGRPRFFTVTNKIEFDRVSDQVYNAYLQAFIDFTPLSASNTTNTVLTNHPSIYVFGCKWAILEFADQYEEAEINYQKFIRAIRGANKKDRLGRYGPAPQMRTEGPTP